MGALEQADDDVRAFRAHLDALAWRRKLDAEEWAKRIAVAEENLARAEARAAELRGEGHINNCICRICFHRRMQAVR